MGKKVDMDMVRKARENLDKIKEEYPDTRSMDDETLEEVMREGKHIQEIYTPTEMAELLGTHRETILRAIRKGEIQAAKIGKQYKITKAEVDRYFQSKGGSPLFEDEE